MSKPRGEKNNKKKLDIEQKLMSEDAQYIFLPKFHQVVNTLTEIPLPFVVLCTSQWLVCSQAMTRGRL